MVLHVSLSSTVISKAKDKEERLLKRQQNRERMEEKRKQKAVQAEEQGILSLTCLPPAVEGFHVHVPHCLLHKNGCLLHYILAEYSKQKCCYKIRIV